MCHPHFEKKTVKHEESIIPADLPEITDIPNYNHDNIDGYIVTIKGKEVIYLISDEAYEAWINTEEIYSNSNWIVFQYGWEKESASIFSKVHETWNRHF